MQGRYEPYGMQEGRGWVSAFRWLGCYPRRKWNGPAPKNEVPGDWPPSFLALPGLGRGRLAPASLEVEGLGSLPWARRGASQTTDEARRACPRPSTACSHQPTCLGHVQLHPRLPGSSRQYM